MRRKEKIIALRVSEKEMMQLDLIVDVLSNKAEDLMISRSSYLRQCIEIGKVLIESNRCEELINLLETGELNDE